MAAAGSEDRVVPLSEVKELKAEVRKLQRLLGKKTMEVETLKDTISGSPVKKNLSRVPLPVKDDTK
jgi:transposase